MAPRISGCFHQNPAKKRNSNLKGLLLKALNEEIKEWAWRVLEPNREGETPSDQPQWEAGTRPPSEAMSRSDESSLALSRNKRLPDTKQVRDEWKKSTKDEKTDSTNPLPLLTSLPPRDPVCPPAQTNSPESYPSLKGIWVTWKIIFSWEKQHSNRKHTYV